MQLINKKKKKKNQRTSEIRSEFFQAPGDDGLQTWRKNNLELLNK